MRSTKTKRFMLIGASFLTLIAIFAATFFIGNFSTHAAAGPLKPYQQGLETLSKANPEFDGLNTPAKNGMHQPFGTCLPGLDSIPNFCGQFTVPGFDNNGNPRNVWEWNMVGNAPQSSGPGTTTFNAPIIPVAVQGLNPDGSVAFTYDPTQFVKPELQSPVFSDTKFTSSDKPTQYTDAIQRAEFFNQAKSNWHTMLNPQVKPELTMKLPAGSYVAFANSDGTCCLAVLVDINVFQDLLFPPTFPVDNTTVIGAAELAGEMTTQDISTLLFPNTYLFFNGDPNQCCVLGFHSFDFEPGVPSNGNRPRAYVFNYSSWISPGLFNGGFQDVTALSHEMAETFNDPFVQGFNDLDLTPWWLSGGVNGLCQNNLEVGDVVEVLDNAVFPITMKNGFTYHPQNEALLQWFESNGTSDALHHAFSYPDETVLTTSNISQNFNCSPPIV
ncbi:MAG TPA: hypothetical protein VFU69_19450 [Ktedonobacterales bacterium]|nr:hypothetical protein [Ktedonobacterales bacterium]